MKKILFLFVIAAYVNASYGQQGSASLNDTTQVKKEEMSSNAPPVMAKKWNQLKTKYFTLNIGAAILPDHNVAVQDNTNIEQVESLDALQHHWDGIRMPISVLK